MQPASLVIFYVYLVFSIVQHTLMRLYCRIRWPANSSQIITLMNKSVDHIPSGTSVTTINFVLIIIEDASLLFVATLLPLAVLLEGDLVLPVEIDDLQSPWCRT